MTVKVGLTQRNKYGVAVRSRKPWEQDYGSDRRAAAQKVFQRDGYRCRRCGCSVVGDPERAAHHIISLSRGGADAAHNQMTVCGKCHASKHRHLRTKS